jgi:transketolase
MSLTMRDRFYATADELIGADERIAVVLADIGVGRTPNAARSHPDRVINVGIREQLMVGVASGLALTGFRPIVHSYAPFIVERPFEMLKLDLGHNDVGAIVVSVGASFDAAANGRTHQTPEDVALISTLPGWRIYVPGHPGEVDQLLRAAAPTDERVYLRLSDQSNQLARPVTSRGLHVERRGRDATVIATGPLLDATLEATADMDVTVLYMTTARPFDADTLRWSLTGDLVVLVEPYLAGTSTAEVATALAHIPHRIAAIGVPNVEHRKYGTWQEHNAGHGLDARGIRARVVRALSGTA